MKVLSTDYLRVCQQPTFTIEVHAIKHIDHVICDCGMHKEKQDNQGRDEFVIESFHNIISLFLSFFSSSLEF